MSKKAKNTDIQNEQIATAEELAAISKETEKAAGAVEMSAEEQMILAGATELAADADEDEDTAQDQNQDAGQGADAAGSFADLMAQVTEAQVAAQNTDLIAAFEARARFEVEKNPANDAIQKKLGSYIKPLQTPGVLRAQVAAGRTAGFVNISESENARRNVYALQKLADLLYGAVTGHVKNAINRAVLGSMVAVEGKDGVPFTGLAARACASDKVGIESNYKALLKRHTVSESTSSTQASSTMTALEDLGVVKNTGTRPHPVYIFTGTPLAERLKEIGGKILAGTA